MYAPLFHIYFEKICVTRVGVLRFEMIIFKHKLAVILYVVIAFNNGKSAIQ